MRSCLVLFTAVAACRALAQEPSFQTANRLLSEQSFSRACDGFEAFLQTHPSAPLAREALAKRAFACWRAGRGDGSSELAKLADGGEKDFTRAFAMWALSQQGSRSFDQAVPLLQQAARAEGRVGAEARGLLVAGCLRLLQGYLSEAKTADRYAELVLELSTNENERAQARFARAQVWLRSNATVSRAERELTEVGEGQSSWADDALFALAQFHEGRELYTEALALYERIIQRFNPTTSNRHGDARSAAETIKRPTLSVSVYQVALPGLKIPVHVSWRNVKALQWTLRRVDPFQARAFHGATSASAFDGTGSVERTWTERLEVKTAYAPGNRSFELEVPGPGLYVVQARGDGQLAQDLALQTQTAVITKSDRTGVRVFVVDTETGQAQANAEVVLIDEASRLRQEARTDAMGLAFIPVKEPTRSLFVWTRAGPNVAFANAGDAYGSNWSRQELAYVMTDRPLYKPGEAVGLKLFLRVREAGPSEPLANRTATIIVRDATGKDIAKPTLTTNAFGTASATFTLPKNAALGAWTMSVTAPGAWYQQPPLSFRVEEFKPPEATVSVTPLGNAKPGEPVKWKVTAKYYSGGPLPGASGRAVVTVTPWTHRFGPWPDEADQPSEFHRAGGWDEEDDGRWARARGWRPFGPVATHTLVFKTSSEGTAELEVPPSPDASTDLQLTAQVFVTDASRREIQGTGTARLSRSAYFLDVRSDRFLYRPGEKVTLRLRAEDANARPASPEVLVRLLRLSDGARGARIAEVRTTLVEGKGLAQLDADALGAVQVEVADVGTPDTALASTELWLTSDEKPVPPPGPGFQLLVDRTPLAAGQVLRALVVAPQPGGHVWLTLEHDLVVTSRVVELKGRTKYVELPLMAELTPNAWLQAWRFENGDALSQQRPVRVRGADTELEVKVAFDRPVGEPGSTVPVNVRATKGPPGPTEVALTVVDEALFAIEPERSDFLPFFGRLPRQSLVRTHSSDGWRLYLDRPRPQPASAPEKQPPPDEERETSRRDAMPASGAAPAPAPPAASAAPVQAEARAESKAKRSMSAGDADDANGLDVPVKPRTDFGTSAGWFAALPGSIDGMTTQPVKLTDSLTAWKATATVVTTGPHLGRGAGMMRTARPLMVRLQTPRFLIEGDEVVLSGVVESHLPKPAFVDVAMTAPGLTPLTPTKGRLTVAPDQVARFDARFRVASLGEQKVQVQAKSGAASDAMELTLPALVHGSAQRQFLAGRLSDSFSFEVELPARRKTRLTRLELALSPSLLSVMMDGLPYLAAYPYGCVEQTLSRFVPAVIARKAATELSLPTTRVPKDLDDMVQKGLERLAGFQHADGGWGWWREDRTNLWMTAYVVYALGLAREAGVRVDAGMVRRGRDFLLGHLGEALNTPDTHAFAVFALAQSGPVPKAVLDQTFERRTTVEPRGRALVALALLAAKDGRARVAVENLDDVVKVAQERPDAAVGSVTDAWSTSAAMEATAYTLMAMNRWPDGSKHVGPLTDFLVLRRNGGRWRSTRDTAFALYALADIARRERAASQQGSFTVTINGRAVKTVRYERGGVELEPLVFDDGDFKPGRNTVSVRRDGGGTGYWAATWDVFNQNDFIRGVGGDVTVRRTYTLLGKPSAEPGRAPTEYGMPVESGVRVRVDLSVTASKAVEFVMLEDLKPAGFEAVQQRSGPEVCNYACAHAELRTDRVALFLPELKVGTTTLSYELRAETPGRFSALPARAEAMYAPEIQATADEMRFEVRDAPEAGVASQP